MLFTTPLFVVFFAACFCVHWAMRAAKPRKIWLLACSYVFYAAWDWRFLFLIFASTAVDYLAGRALAATDVARRRRVILGVSLASNLGILGFFKYYNFFVTSGSELLGLVGIAVEPLTLAIILPVGISFFTFQTLSYTIDIYRGRLVPTRNFFDFALYVGFFPQLVAGPIVRARDFLPQLERPAHFASIDFRRYLLLFLAGYFKKACLADNIAAGIDPVFSNPALYDSASIAIASVGYTIQIYCDFSGYTDMAIACAGLLGYRLSPNFDFPYFSRSLQDFWRRWHISLSTWLRDYLYISLGGGHGTMAVVVRNLMITMVLGGLWHGANWTFLVWGALHGIALAAERIVSARRALRIKPSVRPPRPAGKVAAFAGWAATLGWVVLCFSIFRSPDLASAVTLFERLLGMGTSGSLSLPSAWWILFAGAALLHAVTWRTRAHAEQFFRQLPALAFAGLLGLAVAVVIFFTPLDAAPFIYFQF